MVGIVVRDLVPNVVLAVTVTTGSPGDGVICNVAGEVEVLGRTSYSTLYVHRTTVGSKETHPDGTGPKVPPTAVTRVVTPIESFEPRLRALTVTASCSGVDDSTNTEAISVNRGIPNPSSKCPG